MATSVLAVLTVALDALRAPALIVDRHGKVICVNAAARAFIGDAGEIRRWSPPPPNAATPSEAAWETISLATAGRPDWSLVIFRAPATPSHHRWNLTARQAEVLQLVTRGLTNTSIAETLGIRLGTVEFHISAIFDKVGVNNRATLLATLMGR